MANAQLLASKIVVTEEEPRLRAIPAAPTAVIAAAGVAERGPVRTPTLCQSWEDFLKTFGGFIADGDLATAVYGVYRQDPGASVWVTRVVHYTDITDPLTKASAAATVDLVGTTATAVGGAVTSGNAGPWNLEPGQTLDIHVDEDGGGPETVTFDAARAVRAGSGLSIVDLTGLTLILSVDKGDSQTITFAGTESTAQDVADTINASLLGGVAVVNTGEVDLYGDIRGTDGEVDITGGTALTEIGHSIGTTAGTGDVANINAVTFAELAARIAADVVTATVTVTEETTGEATITSDTTGVSSSVMVEATSTATGFGFDNTLHSGSAESSGAVVTIDGLYDGTYAHDLQVEVAAATNGDADYFNVFVKTSDGLVLEIFPNVQNSDDAADDFVDTVLAASAYVTATDLGTTNRPDNQTVVPASGDDGLTSLASTDFVGDSAGGTGIHAFDTVQVITLLICPGRTAAAEQLAMVDYCESDRQGECFAILDSPEANTATQIAAYMTSSGLKNLSEHGAMFWPWIKVLNPSTTVFGSDEQITVPPSGWVAGVFSRVDASQPGGVYQPPAGVERGRIFGCLGFETDDVLREEVRDYVYPERVNPITTAPGFPRYIDGVWTLKGNGNFPSIAERRGASYIERQIKLGLQFARHSNNDESLRARAFRTVYAFLYAQMGLGAFRTRDPQTAFFVDFSEALNPPSEIAQYKLNGRIGLATQKPAEYIVLKFSQDTRAIEEELAG